MRNWIRPIVCLFIVGLLQQSRASAASPPLATQFINGVMDNPMFLTHAPNDHHRVFVVERAGRIQIIKDHQLLNTPFLDMQWRVSTSGERGLLAMAFHPDYVNNGYFYVRYNNMAGQTTVERYSVSADPDVAIAMPVTMVFTVPQSTSIHNGGWMEFGLDGNLDISIGDGGDMQNAQTITGNWLGKILRININGDDFPADPNRNYANPSSNPFVGVDGDDEIFVYGLRNPFRCAFDRLNGDLWIGDVGANAWEEISVVHAGAATNLGGAGSDFGWPCMEANHCYSPGSAACSCNAANLVRPVFEYDHSLGCAIMGGRMYRGCAIPELHGTYFCADFCTARIWTFRSNADGTITELQQRQTELDPPGPTSITAIVAFGEDADGELYICDQGGMIFKIVSATPAPDANGNGIADSCELIGDITGNGSVNVDDLLRVLNSWGPCPRQPAPCPADVTSNGTVNVDDLLLVINHWG